MVCLSVVLRILRGTTMLIPHLSVRSCGVCLLLLPLCESFKGDASRLVVLLAEGTERLVHASGRKHVCERGGHLFEGPHCLTPCEWVPLVNWFQSTRYQQYCQEAV